MPRRALAPLRVLTNRGVLAVFPPATTARALFSCSVNVLLSRTARFVEYAQTARHDRGWVWGSQTGSAFTLGSLALLVTPALVLRGDGVDHLPVNERVAVPPEVGLQILGGLGDPGADDEPQVRLVELAQIGRRQHARVCHDDMSARP